MTKSERTSLTLSTLAFLMACWCVWNFSSFNHQPIGIAQARTSTDLEPRLKKVESASVGLGEVMCGIQLHFSKLYFAAQARNWDLARFERGEVEEGLEKVEALRPQENGVNLAGIAGAFKETQLVSLKDAIDMKDRSMFRDAYEQSMQMCNTCHQSTGRPFIAITTPTNPPVANQRWEPKAP